MELLDQIAKRPVLLGFERGRREQTHEMFVDTVEDFAPGFERGGQGTRGDRLSGGGPWLAHQRCQRRLIAEGLLVLCLLECLEERAHGTRR